MSIITKRKISQLIVQRLGEQIKENHKKKKVALQELKFRNKLKDHFLSIKPFNQI